MSLAYSADEPVTVENKERLSVEDQLEAIPSEWVELMDLWEMDYKKRTLYHLGDEGWVVIHQSGNEEKYPEDEERYYVAKLITEIELTPNLESQVELLESNGIDSEVRAPALEIFEEITMKAVRGWLDGADYTTTFDSFSWRSLSVHFNKFSNLTRVMETLLDTKLDHQHEFEWFNFTVSLETVESLQLGGPRNTDNPETPQTED